MDYSNASPSTMNLKSICTKILAEMRDIVSNAAIVDEVDLKNKFV